MYRWFVVRLAPLAVLFGLAGPAAAGEEYAEGKRVALVIGISSYEKLPAELQLDSARTEAARVAAALEQGAGFDAVRLLTDASATTANLQEVLKNQVAKEVVWRDLFLIYFVGQGMGSDFGDPRLLMYDTDPERLEATSITVKDIATMLQKDVPASRYVVITDAANVGELNGLALLGPTGNDWPQIGNQSFILSSAGPRQVTQPGVFSKAFVEAISGQADTNGDKRVSGSELNNYLVVSVPNATGGKQLPTVQSSYTPSLELTSSKRVEQALAAVIPTAAAVRVDKAKFVFQGGVSQRVQCPTMQAPISCDPSCYVWEVESGPCQVSMTSNGTEMTGEVNLQYRGAYTCGAFQGGLTCSSPPPPK